MSQVTGLQRISNAYKSKLVFTNTECKGNDRTVVITTSGAVANAWIPWCDNQDQFKEHHMKIEGMGLIYYVWQQGNSIRCTVNGWQQSAPAIKGNSATSQSVYWTVSQDGTLTQFAEK